MRPDPKIAILSAHDMLPHVSQGRLYAPDHYTLYGRVYPDWADVTDMTVDQLRDWLKKR